MNHKKPGLHPLSLAVAKAAMLSLFSAVPVSAYSAGENFSSTKIGGSLELELQQAEGQDVAAEQGATSALPVRDSGRIGAELTLDLEHKFTDATEFVARLNMRSRQYSEDNLNNDDEEFSFRLERFYLEQNFSDETYRWRLGRQSIDDAMNTIIDEDLDGVRFTLDRGDVEFDVSLSQQDLVEASSFDRANEIANVYVTLEFKPRKRTVWMPYVLYRDQLPFGQEPTQQTAWYGLQGIVQPSNNWRYWLHAAAQDGEENSDDETRQLGGFMADIGLSLIIDNDYKPTLTFGFAHGSGGSNQTENRDERFRQSGLHSNDFRLNNKNRFRYLGEVVDPEITNIQILTLGLGAEFGNQWEADLALHTYTQVELETGNRLRGSDLEFETNGLSDDLGVAADFVVSFEPTSNLNLQATAGVFEPGEAFNANQEMAWIGSLELEYDF